MTKIIDGNQIAQKIKDQVKAEVAEKNQKPTLAMVLVGDDSASEIYVTKKQEACQEVGINSKIIKLPVETEKGELLAEIEKLNQSREVTAILVQLPLPENFNKQNILEAINPKKDVDCLNPINFGRFMAFGQNPETSVPVTALAVMEILKEEKIELKSKEAVVVGDSNIVGKPVARLLLDQGATVTVCHEFTKDLKKYTQQADVLITAAGQKHLIKADMVKLGAAVIDIGINREQGKIYGDVDFENVKEVASAITPVPGGVGPVTVAMLLKAVS